MPKRRTEYFDVYMLESKFPAIMRTFAPTDGIERSGKTFRIAKGIYHLSSKEREKTGDLHDFNIFQLNHYVNSDLSMHAIQAKEIESIIKKFVKAELIEQVDKTTMHIAEDSWCELGEFFGLYKAPRTGRSGFGEFLLQLQSRRVLWTCIFLKANSSDNSFTSENVSKLSGLSKETADRHLMNFSCEEGPLKRVGIRYKFISDAGRKQPIIEELLNKLADEYTQIVFRTAPLRERIIGIIQEHEKITPNELYNHLRSLGIDCNEKTVYNHLSELRRMKKIKLAGREQKIVSGKRMAIHPTESWQWNWTEKEECDVKRDRILYVESILHRFGFKVSENFEATMSKQKTAALLVFTKQVWQTFMAIDEHDYLTWSVWSDFLKMMDEKCFPEPMLKCIFAQDDLEAERQMHESLAKNEITPALLAILRFFHSLPKNSNVK